MKVTFNRTFLGLMVAALGLSSCEKADLRITEYDLPSDKTFARFVLLSPGTPSVMIKVNDTKVNGSFTSGFGGVFPSAVGTSADYSAVPSNGNFRLSLPNTATANDSVLIFSGSLGNMSPGKFYTTILADTAADRTVFAIEDVVPAQVDSGFFNLRFVNAIGKSQPLSLVRVDSSATPGGPVTRDTLFQNVAFKQATAFARVPIAIKNGILRYRMIVTATGAPLGNALALSTLLTPAFLNLRSATIYGAGLFTGTGTSSPAPVGFHINK